MYVCACLFELNNNKVLNKASKIGSEEKQNIAEAGASGA